MELEKSILLIGGLRGLNRSQAIENTANKFYNFLKGGNYTQFNKSLFLSFLPDEMKLRTRQNITKDIFKFLIENGKITEFKQDKKYVGLRVKPLSCWDSGSYTALMQKNGFRMAYFSYEYDHKRGIPIKRKVGNSRIGESVNFEYDTAEPVSHKPRSQQAVITNSRLSVVRHNYKRAVKMYKVN